MSTALASDRISHILRLVGPALLLPWSPGSKGGQRKWKNLQISAMGEPSHLAKLARAGNIGIALGKVSNGLVTIDLDQDTYVTLFSKRTRYSRARYGHAVAEAVISGCGVAMDTLLPRS